MRLLSACVFAMFLFFMVAGPAEALPDGKELYGDCTRSDPYSAGYCEGFVIGVLSAHMSPWVVNLQKGKTQLLELH